MNNHLQLVNRQVTHTTLAYALLYYASRFLVDKNIAPSLPRAKRKAMARNILSIGNALFESGLAAYITWHKNTFQTNVFEAYAKELDVLFSHHVGYTIYDMVQMAMDETTPTSTWVHHILGLYGPYLMMQVQRGSYFPCLFMLSEVTVAPTNLVWMAQQLGWSPFIQHALTHFRAWMYLLGRVWIGPYVIWYSFKQSGSLSQYKKRWSSLPRPVAMLIMFNITVLSGLNFVWTKRALQACFI